MNTSDAASLKSSTSLLVLFIPSADRNSQPIDRDHWASKALEFLGTTFGGGTAFPPGRGVWRDDARGGALVYDEPVILNCYTTEDVFDQYAEAVQNFMLHMGRETRQGAVAFVIDRRYLEYSLPWDDIN